MEIKENTYKGTRILFGDTAQIKRDMINWFIGIITEYGFVEMMLPTIQNREIFVDKIGDENRNMMYEFTDRGERSLVLAPEYTAVIQRLADTTFKHQKDVKIFYVGECFRGEKPQAGRYRQFTQFGVEIINPTRDYREELITLASVMISRVTDDYRVDRNVSRGLDYYKDGRGFEIVCEGLGSSKQVCGGGEYDGGIGFAIGIDRILLLTNLIK